MTDNQNQEIQQELELAELEAAYQRAFPKADGFDTFSRSPGDLLEVLRNANGREIVVSYPGLDEGVNDGAAYSYKDTPVVELSNPITLQELLYSRHPALQNGRVKIVRHRDTKQDLYALYRNHRADFLDYQRQQGRKKGDKGVFDACDYIVSFLGEEGSRARFIGVYQVLGIDYETAEHFYYNLTEVPGFDALKERVIIDWGKAAINWHQWLRPEAPKTVLEIQPRPFAEAFRPFKDYLDFTLDFAELQQLVERQTSQDEWWRMLSAVAGVYLILDKSTGWQYIGSAYGTEGVWQRWTTYVETGGHGNNAQLKKLLAADPNHARHFQFTLLMTLPKTMTSQEVIKREGLFKLKFGSRAHGLNNN